MERRQTAEAVSDLRDECFVRAGFVCEWPACNASASLQMAHIEGRKMGGSRTADRIDNVACLCRHHHDVFDGRQPSGAKLAYRQLLAAYLEGDKPRRLRRE